jgi:hypothetical protein
VCHWSKDVDSYLNATLANEQGLLLRVPLEWDGNSHLGVLTIDGTKYHLERLQATRLVSEYRVDNDPDYQPQADAGGYCYMLIPFSQ